MKTTVDVVGRRDRATDNSFLARLASFVIKWQWVLWIFTWLFWAAGFDFTKPSQKFDALAETHAKLEKRVDKIEARGDTIMSILRGLAIDACTRNQHNAYARDRLRCDDYSN